MQFPFKNSELFSLGDLDCPFTRRRSAAPRPEIDAGGPSLPVVDPSGLELRKMRRRPEPARGSLLTRAVNMVFSFVRLAEFEILFVLFFVIAFIIFKDLTSRPEYNDIFVKKPEGEFWSF